MWGAVSQGMASHWVTGRKAVTAERVLAIANASGWRLRPHDLRPDLYPNPDDGLPHERADRSPILADKESRWPSN